MTIGLRSSPPGPLVDVLEGRTFLSAAGPVVTVITPAANVTTPGSAGTSIIVQYTDSAGIELSTITGSNLSIGVGSFAPSIPAVPVTIANVVASTDSTTATVTYDLGAPSGAYYSENDDVYRIELNGSSVLDNAGAAAPANPLLGLYQVLINPLDPSFKAGAFGFATQASIRQPDGKLVLVGSQNPSASQAVLERLNSDGSPDSTFAGTGGVATSPGDDAAFNAVGLQSTGEIVVAGVSDGDLLLDRYSTTGTADSQTATPIDFGSGITATLNGLAVASDNSVYGVGSESNGTAIVAHYLSDGSLDTSFGIGGIATFAVGAAATSLSSVAVANHQLIVAGTTGTSVFVAEVTATGSFVTGFNGGTPESLAGLAGTATDIHSPALAVASDGDLYVASHSSSGDLAIERLTASGQADSTFGSAGIASTHFGAVGTGETDDADSILQRDDGTIVVSGTSNGQSVLAVYNADGSPFSRFVKDAFSSTSDPTGISNQAVATLSGTNAVVLSTSGDSTSVSEFDIAAGPAITTPPSNPTPPVTSSTTTTTTAAPTTVGTLGIVNGKHVNHLTFIAPGGASVTLRLTGAGTVQVLEDEENVDLIIAGTKVRLVATSSGTFTFGSVAVTGSVAQFKAPAATLAGTFSATGSLGTISVGSVTGTIAAAGNITALQAGSLSGATVLAGANLATGGNTYAPASIGTVKISGAIADSTIAAGVNPGTDGDYATSDDRFLGGEIQRLLAASADGASHFEATKFGTVKLPAKIIPANDGRFLS